MQVIGQIFNLIFFQPVVNVLVIILNFLQAIHIPGAFGFSIVIITIFIRFLIWPFIGTQLKSARKMADLKPHLDELKTKHKEDKQALAKAQMDLYKEHGVNPAGGCLPAIIQIPIVIALYQTIQAFFDGASGLQKINGLIYNPGWKLSSQPDLFFLGLNLGEKPSQIINLNNLGNFGFLILLVPLVTGFLQFLQSKMMTPLPVKEYPTDTAKEKKEKGETEDAMVAVQGQMTYLMPVMIGYFAFSFPIGLAIYWNTFTLMGIWQQYLISGWGSLEPWVKRLGLKKS